MAVYLTELFTGTDNAAWNASNWTNENVSAGSSAYIYGNKGRLNMGTVTVYGGIMGVRAQGAGSRTDTECDLTLTFTNTVDGALEIWVRTPSAASLQNGYNILLNKGGNEWKFVRVNDWSYTTLGSAQSFTFTQGTAYKVKFKVTGTGATVTLDAKVWDSGGSEPGSWTTTTDSTASRITSANYCIVNGKGGNASGEIIDIDDLTVSDGAGSLSGSVTQAITRNATVVGVAAAPGKQGQVTSTITRNVTIVHVKAGTLGVFSSAQITPTAIVSGFGGSPAPVLQLTSLNTPSPGVRVTVSYVAPDADKITIYRTTSRGTVSLRGATEKILTGLPFVVDDYEAPLNEVLTYTAITKTVLAVPSTTSALYTIQLDSVYTWLTDPVVPTNATAVRVHSFPDLVRTIDNAMLNVIGSPSPVMVSGQRLTGSGRLSLVTLTLNELEILRSVLDSTPVVLLRAPAYTWDISDGGAAFFGIGTVTEKRINRLISDPTRLIEMDVTVVSQPPTTLTGALHTYAEIALKGYIYRNLSDPNLTYLQLSQRGGL